MDQQFVASLEETLGLVSTPDSTVIKKATAKLNADFYQNPACLPALVQIFQNSQSDQTKQLAAVEARKMVSRHWSSLDPALKEQIRQSVVSCALTGTSKPFRHSSARVTAAIAELDIPNDDWPNLLESLVMAANDSSIQTKEMALFILFCLLETQIPELAAHTGDFISLFGTTLHDQSSSEVRVTSVLALDTVATYIDESAEIDGQVASAFRALIPGMVDVLKSVLASDDSDKVRAVFEVFNSLLMVDAKLVGEQFQALVQIMLEISLNVSFDQDYRVCAMQFLISCANFRKSKLNALKLGPQLSLGALQIASEEIDVDDELDNEDEENENEENVPSTLALRLLAMLSAELPPSQVIAPIFEQVPNLLSSSNQFQRRAAILALGVTCEGAPDYFSAQVPKLVHVIVTGLNDPELIVKAAALRACTQLTTEMQDAITEYHAQLLPLIIGIIDSATKVRIYKYATYCLDGIIEYISHDNIFQYLDPLMNKLFSMLSQAHSASLKTAIVSAIGSTAFAAGKAFVPYFEKSIQFLQRYLSTSEKDLSEDEVELSATTFENVSTMARAVGSEPFAPYAQALLSAAAASINCENSRLRESGFAFVANMAKVYGPEFAGYLETIVPEIFKCLAQEEFQFDLPGGEDEDADEDEEDLANKFQVHTGITIEKEIASVALSELARGTGKAFGPFVEPSIKLLQEQIDTSYGMREAALSALWNVVKAMFDASGEVNADVLSIVRIARETSLTCLEEEFELQMVAALLDNFTEAIKKMGKSAIIDGGDSSYLEKLCVQLMMILKKEHPCQVDDEEIPSDEVDQSETDALLFDSALEVLVALSHALGTDFNRIFVSFKPSILAQVNSKSKVFRVSAVGSLAEICVGMKEHNPYSQELLSLFTDRLQNDRALDVKGNAAFGIGVAVEHSTADFSQAFPVILPLLSKLLDKTDQEIKKTEDGDEESRDVINRAHANACGCVSRMALKNLSVVPVDAVLPVLLDHLPLPGEFEENTPIFKLILQLYASDNQLIQSQTPKVVSVFEHVFSKEMEREKLARESTLGRENTDLLKQFKDDELKAKVVELLRFLEGKYAGVVSQSDVLRTVIGA